MTSERLDEMEQIATPAAFPWADPNNGNGESGMSLRDWFAGQALIGLIQRRWEDDNGDVPVDILERWSQAAYRTADAMLTARAALSQHRESE